MTATLLDRFVRWNLDLDGGDLYGDDERERLRWYEGIATAAQVQGIAVPWAIAITVWFAGRSAVVPLLVVLAAWVAPMFFTTLYVQGRRVATTPRSWSGKRVLLGVLAGLPIVVFAIGAIYQNNPDGFVWQGSAIGAVIGGSIGIALLGHKTKQRRRADEAAPADVD
jgi:Flp pilus assembly protein TadB